MVSSSEQMDKEQQAALHRQLVRLGDMIGDGLADELGGRWIRQEYRRVMRALGHEVPRRRRPPDPQMTEQINTRMSQRVAEVKCPVCQTLSLKQSRSGSMRANCQSCGRSIQLLRKGRAKK